MYLKKTCKTQDNPFGIREITDENPLQKGPCIITILALPILLKQVNGSLRQVAELVNPDIDNHYDPDRRILGLGFGDYIEQYGKFTRISPSKEEVEDFLNRYFCPLFMENDKKTEVLKAMKNFRNITFLTYCNGAKVFQMMEETLKQKMEEVGYSKDEVGMILSQVCLAAISGDVISRTGTSTLAFSFGDVNDYDYEQNVNIKKSIRDMNQGFIHYGSSIGFAIARDGEHSLKKHMTENPVLSSMISCFLNTSIDNALENRNQDIMNPISYEKMQNAFDSLNDSNHKTL